MEGGVHHEEVCQAESEVFGPPETSYQVQFLNGLVKRQARARSGKLVVPKPTTLGNSSRGLRVQLRMQRKV